MMKFDELVNDTKSVISFEQISEPRTKEVRLRIIINKSNNSTDLLIYPHPDSNVTTLYIDFSDVVAYSVIYEDYTIENNGEIYIGKSFRIYQKSNLLESLLKICKDKKLKHFSLICFEHIIDIITYEDVEPKVTEVSSQTT
jgi:hypothetical protein